MSKKWTRLDETNVPTDTSRALLLKRNDTQVVEYWWPPWTPFVGDGWNDIESYKYTDTPPEVPPTPELVPCRCGGKARIDNVGDYSEIICDNHDCYRCIGDTDESEAIRMWNAANKPEENVCLSCRWWDEKCTHPKSSVRGDAGAERMPASECSQHTKSEMPDEIVVEPFKPDPCGLLVICAIGLKSDTTTDRFKTLYHKEKTCKVKFNKASTISGPTWTCAECGYNRVLENNTHCGNCGAKIERSET